MVLHYQHHGKYFRKLCNTGVNVVHESQFLTENQTKHIRDVCDIDGK